MLAGAVTLAVTWSPIDFIAWAVGMVMVVLGLVVRAPRLIWRLRPDTETPFARSQRWFWGQTPLGWGFIRAGMAGLIGFGVLMLGLGFAMFGDMLHVPALTDVGLVLAFVFLLVALLFNAIILWNRPRFLVPPGLRGQPGFFRARRALKDLKRQNTGDVDGIGPIFTDDRP